MATHHQQDLYQAIPPNVIEACIAAWKSTADSLILRTSLRTHLDPFGTVLMVGSYASDLILSPDIDIHIITALPSRQQAIGALHAFLEANTFEGITYFDWQSHIPQPSHLYPKASYLGLSTHINGLKWKIDCWFLSPEQEQEQREDWLVAGLKNPLYREVILQLKIARTFGRIKTSGFEIYRAVIQEGVQSVEAFRALHRDLSDTAAEDRVAQLQYPPE